jgi:predicted Zn-dependent protease
VFAACAVLYAGVGFWGFGRDILMLKGDYHDKRVVITGNSVLSATYTPDPAMEAEAKAGIRAYELAGPPSLGGWGWKHDIETPARLAWLYAVSGDLANTEVWARRALEYDRASPDLAMDLLSVMRLQKKPESEIASTAKALLARHPSMHNLRMPLAAQALQAGKPQEARSLLMELARTEEPATPQTYLQAAEMLANVPDIPAARQIVNAGLAAHPEAVALRIAAAMQLIQDGNVAAGKEKLLAVANGSQPPAQEVFLQIADLLAGMQDFSAAESVVSKGRAAFPDSIPLHVGQAQIQFFAGRRLEALATMKAATEAHPGDADLLRSYAGLLRATGSASQAAEVEARAAGLPASGSASGSGNAAPR